MAKNDIIALNKADFPPLLTEITDAPEKLYLSGNVPDWNRKTLCVVGARRNSTYGREATERLVGGLEGYPVTIVSGLALGIDAIAHRAALAANLPTIAVPGSGLSEKVLYPSTHRELARKIVEAGGALLSEYEPDFRATTWSFPRRNRIMAGLSHAVLIIEAEMKSGTLITARLAMEYNRDVLTVPGDIFSKNTAGPHYLIRNGATPITSADDLIEALGFKKPESTVARDLADCSAEEREIMEFLVEPMARDELLRRLSMPTSDANTYLGLLEMKGYIKEAMGELRRT